jgi:hypothetical protein
MCTPVKRIIITRCSPTARPPLLYVTPLQPVSVFVLVLNWFFLGASNFLYLDDLGL